MKKTVGLMALLLVLPAPLPPVSIHAPPSAPPTAFGGFDDLDDSNGVISIIGDTQVTPPWEFWFEENEVQTRTILAEIAARGPAAVINLGDLVDFGSSIRNWKLFDDLHAPVIAAGIPYFAVWGNHDYRGPDELAKYHVAARFPHLRDRSWHAFRFRYAGIVLLDTNFGVLGREKADEQTWWLERTLAEFEASPDVRVVICCTHHPPYSNSVSPVPQREVRQRFVPSFQRLSKPALFFSGHVHSYEHFLIGGKHFIVSGGGGGHRCRVQTGLGRRITKDLYQGPPVRSLHFCQLEFGPQSLTLRVVYLDDFLSYRFFVDEEFDIPFEGTMEGEPISADTESLRLPAGSGELIQ